MRILVMGGTWFLGRQVADDALARGWEVTTFNRGQSAPDVTGVRPVRGDRTSATDLNRLAAQGPWDAVIDASSSDLPPKDVLLAARALEGAVDRWVHISTVSVYEGWPNKPLTEESPLLACLPTADASFGYTGPAGSPTEYGFQKAGGERAVTETLGADRVLLLRPGVILGPGEYVGRLPWWLSRASMGGRILVPAPADRRIQPVDVRDVAAFALDQAQAAPCGGLNVTHPQGLTMAEFLTACLDVVESEGELVWAGPEILAAHGVQQWTELPLWRTHPGVWDVDSRRAVEAGLRCRPLKETVQDTWAWLEADGRPVPHPRWAEHGINPDREAAILAYLD